MLQPLAYIKMIKWLCIIHRSMFIGIGTASALSVSPFNRSKEYNLQINIRQGTKELGAFNCLDILSSNFLMSYKIKTIIEVGGDDPDIMEISYTDDVNEDWSRIERLYNGALNSVNCSEDNIKTFRNKAAALIEENLTENLYAVNICGYTGNLTLVIPDQRGDKNYLKHLSTIFKMRNELLLKKQEALSVETMTEILKDIPILRFKKDLYSDVFFNLADGKSKHFVTSKDFLFAINVAIQLHHMNFFQQHREYFHFPVGFEPRDGRRSPEFHKFKEVLTLNKIVWWILSVIDFDVNSSNEIRDIVIRHINETFGCGLREDGKLILRPCFAFGTTSYQIASVFVVFDKLSAYKNITQLHAVCHEKMGNNVQYFYYYLINLFPKIEALDLEESVYDNDDDTKSKEYCETKTYLNTVLDFMLVAQRDIRKQIKHFSVRGYNVLSENNLIFLRSMPLESLGLYGNFLIKDYINAYALMGTRCEMSKSLNAFKSSAFCHDLLDAICPVNKLTKFVFYMGHQDCSMPDKAFEGKADLFNELKCYFIGQDLRKGVRKAKTCKNIEEMAILYRYNYYTTDPTNSEKLIMRERIPETLGEVEDLIFMYYKAETLFLETRFYLSAEKTTPAVKTVIFNTSSSKYFDYRYAQAAMRVLDRNQGHLEVSLGVNTTDKNTELYDIANNIAIPLIDIMFKVSYKHKIKNFKWTLKIKTRKALRKETSNTIQNGFKNSIDAIRRNRVWFSIVYIDIPTASEYTIENIMLE
ncbi:hypothetical protein ENBRE01_0603 [Enteropsectra breve]|nr:hypothetical protein ENBRE01_0603 [Enteropsectra breve]